MPTTLSPPKKQTSREDSWIRRVARWDDEAADKHIRSGVSVGLAERLQVLLDLSDEEAAHLIGRSRSTYARYKKKNKDLGVTEAERAVRYARLLHLANETFGSFQEAVLWMQEPNQALGGATPIHMARTDPGATIVRDVLEGIQHGVAL